MKKYSKLIVALLSAACLQAMAFEESEAQGDASDELIKPIIQQCQEYAVEDEIADASVMQYLLTCVNEDLEMFGYNRISQEKLASLLNN